MLQGGLCFSSIRFYMDEISPDWKLQVHSKTRLCEQKANEQGKTHLWLYSNCRRWRKLTVFAGHKRPDSSLVTLVHTDPRCTECFVLSARAAESLNRWVASLKQAGRLGVRATGESLLHLFRSVSLSQTSGPLLHHSSARSISHTLLLSRGNDYMKPNLVENDIRECKTMVIARPHGPLAVS